MKNFFLKFHKWLLLFLAVPLVFLFSSSSSVFATSVYTQTDDTTLSSSIGSFNSSLEMYGDNGYYFNTDTTIRGMRVKFKWLSSSQTATVTGQIRAKNGGLGQQTIQSYSMYFVQNATYNLIFNNSTGVPTVGSGTTEWLAGLYFPDTNPTIQVLGKSNVEIGYDGGYGYTVHEYLILDTAEISDVVPPVPAVISLTAPNASTTQDFTSWIFDFTLGSEYSALIPAKYFQYVVDYGVSSTTLNSHNDIQEIFVNAVASTTTTTSQVPKTESLIQGETYFARVRLQIAKIGVGEIEYQNIATSSIVSFTVSETGIQDTRADFNGTLYIPDIPTSSPFGVSTSSPFYLDCSMYTFTATGTDLLPMFEYVDVFGVDLIPVPTANFFDGVVCYAKIPVYQVASYFFVPHNFSVNIWNGSINKMKTVFPFKLYFDTMDTIKTYMGENSTSSATLAVSLPAPKSGLPAMSMTFLSSTILIDTIGATSTSAWYTGFSSLLWILFLVIVIKVLYEIFDENDQDI